MRDRAPLVERALSTDASLWCGVDGPGRFAAAPVLPAGCAWELVTACTFASGLEIAPAVVRDAGAKEYVRVQNAATALRKAGHLSPSHVRLFETLLLSRALRGESQRPRQRR